jgi:Carboxypeptidase regulatory-like domain
MMSLFGSLLTAVLFGQAPADRVVEGMVADEQGKPIAGAKVVLYAPPSIYLKGDSAVAQAQSDGEGKFSVKVPPLGRIYTNNVYVWGYRPGLAIAAVQYEIAKPHQIALREADPRIVKVEGADGKPVAGARVQPRLLFFSGGIAGADVPDRLAGPLDVTTGADGTATVVYLRGRDRLVAARVEADTIGEQDVAVTEETSQGSAVSTFVIKLKRTSRLAGRIVDQAGQGIANQAVEIWSKGGTGRLGPNLVGFKKGPVRTGADGAFQTPDNLSIGASYRAAVREPGKEPIISDWAQINEQPVAIPPLSLRALRTVNGRVIDRQGKAVEGVEVFQSGDGPERTSVRTDSAGRFALGGFPSGPVFLFARGEGYRFHGQMLKPGEEDITVELTRSTERPRVELKKLGDPIPIEESRSMARRILDKWWKAAVEQKDEGAKFFVVQFLIPADPVGALKKIDAIKFPTEKSRARLQSLAARALARSDFEEGESVAESITDPGVRAETLAHLADLLPANDKQRKLAILERALFQAKATSTPSDHVYQLGELAGRLLELGEIQKAKEVFAEGLRRAKQFKESSSRRGSFAGLLARVDLPGAMELARQLAGDERYGNMIVSSIAFGLPWDKPADANLFLSHYPLESATHWLTPVIAWKIASLDPARARKLVDACRDEPNYFEAEFCLALGAKGRNETVKNAAVQAGLEALDRAVEDQPQALMQYGGQLLAVAEAIDPALVAEVMWRAVSARPATGNPRIVQTYAPTYLLEHVAWYDRGVTAALLDPLLMSMDKASDRELVNSDSVFELWTMLDPRAAVARLDKIPMTSVNPNDNRLWIYVIEKLALDREARWRRSFIPLVPIFDPANRDFMIDRF